jgi:hypothetical protein
MEKESDDARSLHMGKVFLLSPLGFAIWYVPLIHADIIGLPTAVLIIAGIFTFLIIINMIAPNKRPRIDHSRDKELKTYTV